MHSRTAPWFAAALWLVAAATPVDARRCTQGSKDSDHDGLANCMERRLGTNPHSADTDHDGLSDGLEVSLGTDPGKADTDGDGRNDGLEQSIGRNPNDAGDKDQSEDTLEVRVESPLSEVNPEGGSVSVLNNRLCVDAKDAELEGAADLVDLKAQLDAADEAGTALGAKILIQPESVVADGCVVAQRIEVHAGTFIPTVRCCVSKKDDQDEGKPAECKIETATHCDADGGLNLGPGSCDPSPCP